MLISSDDLDNIPEGCSNKKVLQIQLNNEIYISDIDDNNIEIEQNKEEIIQGLQNLSFEEAVAINKNDLDKNLELTQKINFMVELNQIFGNIKILSKVALIADFWTSLKMENFLAITIYFIDKNWNLQHFVLDIFQFKCSYTGESIANKVYSLLEEFKIETKVIVLTTDNDSNMILLQIFYKLILTDFCYYRYMLLVKCPILKTYMPYKEKWNIYKNLVDLLELFNDATIELLSQTYPTIAHAQIILLALRKDLESKKNEVFLLHYVVDVILSKYIEYFHLITELFYISTFLNTIYNKYCFSNLDIEKILMPIRKKMDQQLLLPATKPKKISSFYQKLKYISQLTHAIDNEVKKHWLYTKADETIKLLDWCNTHTAEYPML
ncbi:27630_t:CDS:2 [Gigaspora margarita]|uniref:27630_t:CDS:1 n=1 Tax=Gigaspora margarita TaxID=4874 RepID=A0ABN7UXP2_GIGMA|nr:27630_t:CDS:2 [Gigaspora margarita]